MYRILLLITFFFLSGCTSVHQFSSVQKAPPYNQKMTWAARSDQLYNISVWTLQGAASIETSSQTVFTHFTWHQDDGKYYLQLVGPLGLNAIEMGGTSEHFYFNDGKQKHTATTPEQLMDEQLGWILPVSPLYYWIRGIPTPNKQAIKKFDAYHHLVLLKQGNWTIKYTAWIGIRGVDLPSKISITHPKIQLRLAITGWNI